MCSLTTNNGKTQLLGPVLVLKEARAGLASWPTHHYHVEALWAETTGIQTHPGHILYPVMFASEWSWADLVCFEAE